MTEIAAILFTVVIAENLAFFSGVALPGISCRLNRWSEVLFSSLLLLVSSLLSSEIGLVCRNMLGKRWPDILTLGIQLLLVMLIFFGLTRALKPWEQKKQAVPVSLSDSWLLVDVLFLSLTATLEAYTYYHAFLYCLGGTLGFLLAALLMLAVKPRIPERTVQKGMYVPLRLLTAGLVGLIFWTFSL